MSVTMSTCTAIAVAETAFGNAERLALAGFLAALAVFRIGSARRPELHFAQGPMGGAQHSMKAKLDVVRTRHAAAGRSQASTR
jgi:hypothetical protein